MKTLVDRCIPVSKDVFRADAAARTAGSVEADRAVPRASKMVVSSVPLTTGSMAPVDPNCIVMGADAYRHRDAPRAPRGARRLSRPLTPGTP